MYNGNVPSFAFASALKADSQYVPPDFKQPAGRPNKKRKESDNRQPKKKIVVCRACGGEGHLTKSCTNPSTEYRYNNNKEKEGATVV